MIKYVILTPQIGDMGGGQMFACNKAEYMTNLGWEVTICYFTESPILIKKYYDFKRICIPQLRWGIQYYTPYQVNNIVKQIVYQIGIDTHDEVIVESHLCYLSLWAELLAEKLKAKHIINSFEEDIPTFTSNAISFFEYKLKRWECVNASENSLRRLFKSYFKEEYNRFNHSTSFFCSNVTDDNNVTPDVILPDTNSFNILSIGRLNKPYIQVMLSELFGFAEKYSSTPIGLVFVGASPDGSVEKDILDKFNKLGNVKIYLLGYMFPIPQNVFECANISISTSNAVLVTHEHGIPTIAVDATDSFAIGIYGINTYNKVFRKEEPQIRISEYVEKLYKGEMSHMPLSLNNVDKEDPFIEQVKFLSKSKMDGKYFDVHGIYSTYEVMFGIVKRIISSTLKRMRS